jgi:hypothetical protein
MLHTIYAASGKISHIHGCMCEWDYTIDKSLLFTKRKKEVMLELPIIHVPKPVLLTSSYCQIIYGQPKQKTKLPMVHGPSVGSFM